MDGSMGSGTFVGSPFGLSSSQTTLPLGVAAAQSSSPQQQSFLLRHGIEGKICGCPCGSNLMLCSGAHAKALAYAHRAPEHFLAVYQHWMTLLAVFRLCWSCRWHVAAITANTMSHQDKGGKEQSRKMCAVQSGTKVRILAQK